MDENKKMLDETITKLFNKLKELEPGTETYEAVAKNLDRLYRLRNDEMKIVGELENQRVKIENERVANDRRLDIDLETNVDKIREDRRQHKSDKIFNAVEFGAKILFTAGLGILGYMFEEHGHLCSPTRKTLEATFRPKL